MAVSFNENSFTLQTDKFELKESISNFDFYKNLSQTVQTIKKHSETYKTNAIILNLFQKMQEALQIAYSLHKNHCIVEQIYNVLFSYLLFVEQENLEVIYCFADVASLRAHFVELRSVFQSYLLFLVNFIKKATLPHDSSATNSSDSSNLKKLLDYPIKVQVFMLNKCKYCQEGRYNMQFQTNENVTHYKFNFSRHKNKANKPELKVLPQAVKNILPPNFKRHALLEKNTFAAFQVVLADVELVKKKNDIAIKKRNLHLAIFNNVNLANLMAWLSFNSGVFNGVLPDLALLYNPLKQKNIIAELLDWINYLNWKEDYEINDFNFEWIENAYIELKRPSYTYYKSLETLGFKLPNL